MSVKKFFIGIFVPFWLIIPAVEAYQNFDKPDTVYIEYESKDGTVNVLGMYDYAANALIGNMEQGCFQVMADTRNKRLTHSKRYRLVEGCSDSPLFSKMLELYQQAVNAPPDEVVGGLVMKRGYVIIKYLSVEINQNENIITRLTI